MNMNNISRGQKEASRLALLAVIAFASMCACTTHSFCATYYVATTGLDSNAGDLNGPWRTLSKAAATVVAGDTVYVRGGTYYEQVILAKSGTSASPITFTGYPGDAVPIISLGSNWAIDGGDGGVVEITGDYNVFNGLTVQNGTNAAVPTWSSVGIRITGNNSTVTNNTVQFIPASGIWIQSNNNVISGNTVQSTALVNYGGTNSFWGTGIAIQGYEDGVHFLSNNVISNNFVYNNWGEGIYAFYGVSNTRIQGNEAYNNWSLNIGLANSYNSTISNNLSYYASPPSGMGIGLPIVVTIDGDSTDPAPLNNSVYNNFVYGSHIHIAQFSSIYSPIRNTTIYYNTVVNPSGDAIWIGGVQNGLVIRDNLFVGNGSNTYYTNVDRASNNYWLTQPFFPNDQVSNLSSPSTDIVGNALPYLAQTPGSPTPGELHLLWFKVLSAYPGRAKGVYLPDVPNDAFGIVRPTSCPDIGAAQYTP
jgi:parallel beta-helix repeat protein